MKIATWNIYWLGDRDGEHIVRTDEDKHLIANVIKNLSPDVLALQEIVDPLVMQEILEMANGEGRDYTIRSGQGDWLTSDSNPEDESNGLQKVFLCINRVTVEYLRGAAIRGGPGGRRPFAAVLRHRVSGAEFVTVAAHLRAGYPGFLDKGDADVRREEAAALALWLQGKAAASNPSLPEPGNDDVVVLGDFNAELKDPNKSLVPLGAEELSKWTWDNPEPDGSRWETAIYENDHLIIDFIILSPAMADKVTSPPTIYAWDYDPALGGPTHFHHGAGGSGKLKNYKVSDHRPVIADLDY
jgi:endonuclease/exonuclease/phosphatase family metal-dependent hydrolase